jgi:penicillin-insensitive murein endopeptidase
MPPGLSDAEIAVRLTSNPESLGPLSLGRPSHGGLRNGRQMTEAPFWHVVEPDRAWGTDEAILSLERAILHVNTIWPGSPKLYVGHLSAQHGGYLKPHRSHQSGRDVDLGFYYRGGPGWYQRATAANLDRGRTWTLVKALASDPNVESIFVDRSVQLLIRDHAEHAGESFAWLESIFEGSPRGPERLIRHEWGHLTHLHVRFRCQSAQDAGVRAERPLEALRRAAPRRY